MAELQCWNCGESLDELPRPITRHMNCPACSEDLHCCRLCRHYAPSAAHYGACDEERAEPPVYKESANFCDYFRPATAAFREQHAAKRDAAQANLDALFGEGEDARAPSEADEARRRLDDLFR
jgi:hypothetical protein